VDGGAALEAVLERGFDPAARAVVEGDPGIEPVSGASGGSARYAERRPEDVRIDVFANAPSIVVVRNTWERGWSATVDGRPAPLVRADFFLQGVPVPEGHHEIRLVYREPAIGMGLLGSAAAWGAFAAALVAAVVLTRRATRTRAARRGV
jgi:hypothetical protein